MGASVAFHLARSGMTDVVLVERESLLGTGSTGKNAGGVRHQFSHEANVRLSIESIRFFENFEEEVGAPLDFHQDGYLFLLSTEQAWQDFQRNAKMQEDLGVSVEVLTPEQALEYSPGLNIDGVIGATYCARDGIADPHGVTQGFAKAAKRMGVEIVSGTPVQGIQTENGRIVSVRTDEGSIETRTVVNAAGPWAAKIGDMAGITLPVAPYRRHIYIASTRPEPGSTIMPVIPQNHIMVIDFESSFYFHKEGPNVLFGMGEPNETPSFEETVDDSFLEKIIPVATSRLPALSNASLLTTWAGLYEVTPDAMPILGETPSVSGFYLINGFSGHGFQHAPAAGRLVAETILGRKTDFDLTPFNLARFSEGSMSGEANVV